MAEQKKRKVGEVLTQCKILLVGGLFGSLFPLIARGASDLDRLTSPPRPSLQKFAQDWGNQDWVTERFAKPEAHPEKKLDSKALAAHKQLLSAIREGKSFARGEIETESNLNALLQMIQWSLLDFRDLKRKEDWNSGRQILSEWLKFAADFPYEEWTMLGLKAATVVRALVFDEVETILSAVDPVVQKKEIAGWIQWAREIRAPWPVDRILLSESRRILPAAAQTLGVRLANELQKNPYQTAASVLDKLPGGEASSANFLRQMWKDEDLKQMKMEVHRLQKIQLRWGIEQLKASGKAAPFPMDQIAKAAGFAQVPVDYMTGKTWNLESLSRLE